MIKLLSLFLLSTTLQANFEQNAPALADLLKKNLMGELQKQIKESGTAQAVDFCHLNVKGIAQKTAKSLESQYEFGRTSHKVRNQNNLPKEWMQRYLEQFKTKRQGDPNSSAIFITLDDKKKAYLEPLWVGPLCLQCHGENVSKNVLSVIDSKYPEDHATGFKLGEFRGLLWVKEK